MVETESSITSILTAYEKQEKRRALGGIYALAGFDYQLRFYLANFVESLTNQANDLEIAGGVFLEALSDVAKQDDNGHLVCIQVKRTLTLASLKDAASEVLAVDQFLKEQYPNMLGKVKFNLVASQGSSDIQWSDIPATHKTYSIISQLLTEKRLLSPRIEPDPWWRAIATVWPHLKDPYGFMRFALERAISRGPSPTDAQRIRDEICERFKQGLLEKKSLGQPLTQADFQLKVEPSTNLQVGHEITLARLRDHQYMAQTQRLNSLYANLLEYKDAAHRELSSIVQVFWLSGRSGAGKSVLLLQTLEQLVHEGFNVLWLKGNSESLEPALRAFKEAHKQDQPDFIAIDDLYDHDARNRIDLNRLGEFIDESENQNWPIILTCGPTEFADSFEEDAIFRGFNLNRYQIAPLAAKEAEELEVWYQKRTGKLPLKGSAFNQAADEDNGLFISLAVELAHGDLKTFAQRFAKRVELNDLNKALCLPLALNRLYLRAPYDWLTKEEHEKLDTLNHEGDFNLLETADEGQIVRLTHPHLANALYLALRKPANSEAYTNDLVDTFHRALTEQNTGLVSQLLRLYSGRVQGMATERLRIIKLPNLAIKCAKHWHKHSSIIFDADNLADMATSWACWATTAPEITSTFNKNILSTALSHLGTAYKAWSICWQNLADHYPKDEELFSWAEAHLPDPLFIKHPTWSFVWEFCLQHDSNSFDIWHKIGLEWLQQSLFRPDWHFVWRKLLPEKLLPENVEPDWEQNPVLVLGIRRLHGKQDDHVWAYVMQDLLRLVEPNSSTATQLIELAKTWLIGREDHVGWSFVWKALLEQREALPESLPLRELLLIGATWLNGREERDGWVHVCKALVQH
ncbi:RNA-binding protein, partial [Pseudoalteromonas sp. S2721]